MSVSLEPLDASHVDKLVEIDQDCHTYYDEQLDMDIISPGFWSKEDFKIQIKKGGNGYTAMMQVNQSSGRKVKYVYGCVVYEIVDSDIINILKFIASPKLQGYIDEVRNALFNKLVSKVRTGEFKSITITVSEESDQNYGLVKYLQKKRFKLLLMANKDKAYSDKWFCSWKPSAE